MKTPIPPWKRVVLTQREWPDDLVVPRPNQKPSDAECLRELYDWSLRFGFYLYRDKRAPKYYFRVWREKTEPEANQQSDCVVLNPEEAYRLLILQEVKQQMIDDVRRFRARMRSARSQRKLGPPE